MAKQTAKAEYEAKAARVAELIARLQAQLADHREDFEATGSRDWGYVGDLEHTAELLAQALGCEA